MDIVLLPWDGTLDELVGSEVTNSTILSVGSHNLDSNEPVFPGKHDSSLKLRFVAGLI